MFLPCMFSYHSVVTCVYPTDINGLCGTMSLKWVVRIIGSTCDMYDAAAALPTRGDPKLICRTLFIPFDDK